MNQIELGKQIAKFRKEAGYTQQSLADALLITDKAVSKWERGICLPDSSILPKLAGLLDTDLGSLIPFTHYKSNWKGLLIFNSGETTAGTLINGKPLIHYLLSYFLLLKITDVAIITDEKPYVKELNLSQYGLNISYAIPDSMKTMVVFGKTLLFGAYLSQQLLNIMASEETVIPVISRESVPILFTQEKAANYSDIITRANNRSLYRGTVNIPLNTMENIVDAETFIKLYEKHNKQKFCDLFEIARCRGIIT